MGTGEVARLAALRRYCLLDTGREARFDDLTRLTAGVCQVPVSLISLVDTDRLFFKSAHGMDVREVPYPDGFCGEAIRQREIFEICDTRDDARYAGHPLVTDPPNVRFYAGAPLYTDDGFALGTLCAIDFLPRKLEAEQREMLRLLARQVMVQFELGLQSMRDPLTGLYNRRPLEDTLAREISRARRSKAQVGVMAIDADNFKAINDTLGHEAGDAVLRSMARVLSASVRDCDIVCRSGGEEFIIVLPEMGEVELLQRAEVVRSSVEVAPIEVGARTVRMTVSIGTAVFPEHGTTENALLRSADIALYQAKAAGRNRVVLPVAPRETT